MENKINMRQLAEKKLQGVKTESRPFSEEDLERLIHDYQVHKIELEMQNEELQSAQSQIEESRSRYTDLYDFAPIGYCTLNRSGLIEEINLKGADQLGVERGELLQKPFLLYVALEERPRFRSQLIRALKGPLSGKWETAEFRINTMGGSYFDALLEGMVSRDLEGRPILRLAVVDITRRKQAEEAQRISEERFRRCFELGLIGMTITSPAKGFMEVNDRLCEILGYERNELLQKRWTELTHPDDLGADLALFNDVLAGKIDAYTINKRCIRKDGQVIYATIAVKCLRREDGSVDYFVALLQDITQRKQADEALADYTRRLQSLSGRLLEVQETERRQIARELHDEIGQSLTAIKIQLHAAQRHADTRMSKLEECLQVVDQALAQVQSLSLNLHPPQLDDLGLSAALRWYLDRQARAANLSPQFSIDPLPARLHADLEIACFRVAQEALTNVIRHAEADQVLIELRQRSDELHLIVQDNGQGFDVDAARNHAISGTSMGLTGMQERTELAGGRLELISSFESGTKIHAVFPIAYPPTTRRSKGKA